MAPFAAHAVAIFLLGLPGQADTPSQRDLFEEFDLPPVTREQLESALKDRLAKPGIPPWARWLGGNGAANPTATGLSPASLAAMLKMFGSLQAGPGGFDAQGLAKWLAAMGPNSGMIDPVALREMMALAGRLGSQKEALKATYPQFDWDRFSELAGRLGSQPSRIELQELVRLLERLKAEPGPLGAQDLESIKALLGRFQGLNLPQPDGNGPMPIPEIGRLTERTGAFSGEMLGKLGEILRKLGLNNEQIGKVADWLKAIPAPGLKGNLAEWASNVDWAKFAPGKWRDWSPQWAVSSFDWMKPRLGFLKNLPSLRIPRIPTASLPGLPTVSLEAPQVSWRDAAIWAAVVMLPVLVILAYMWRDRFANLLGGEARRGAPTFDHVSDLVSLVQLFEREALRILGPDARFHHIRRIESDLMEALPAPDQRKALRLLTSLYERWRYLPEAWHPGMGEIREGTHALGIIAAGPTA